MPLEQARPTPVSRETRRLLAAAALALVTLWVLARIRFPDQPVAADPVSPLLTQITATARFEDLARELGELQARVIPTLLERSVPVVPEAGSRDATRHLPAWWFTPGAALLLVPHDGSVPRQGAPVAARNEALGLLVVRAPEPPGAAPSIRVPDRLDRPRYVYVAVPHADTVSLTPVLIDRLRPVSSAAWRGIVWSVPAGTSLPARGFVFAADGSWLGAAAQGDGGPAIVPAATLIAEGERLLARPSGGQASPGFEVQALTPALAAAAGGADAGAVDTGVLVTWTDPGGVAADAVHPGDIVEMLNGEPITTPYAWKARLAALGPGDVAHLRLRRGGVRISAAVPLGLMTLGDMPPGLVLAAARGGSRVRSVEPASTAAEAGIEPGDLITFAGPTRHPSPAQLRDVLGDEGGPVLIGITRGERHFVVSLRR